MNQNIEIEKENADIEQGSKGRMKSQPRTGGGWKSMPYIIGNETFEKLSSMSLIANLVVYLRTQYNLDATTSVTIFSIWTGTCNFSPLLGAYLSDAYIGKYRTLICGSLMSTLGMLVLALTADVPHMKPHPCLPGMVCEQPTTKQLLVLYTGLGLLVIGAGGIRPCNIAFGVDQFDITTEKGKKDVSSFYNWYYLSFTLALLVALTVVVYIQSNISWAWGLAIPAGFMLLSVCVFLLGSRLYVYVKPKGSVFVGMTKVAVATFRKRKLTRKEYTLYDTPTGTENVKIVHTDKFKCLDKAAIITDRDVFSDKGLPMDEWRLCNVEKVEQLKSLISILPVWAAGLTSFIIMDQQNTFGVQQAMQMDTRLFGKIKVPPGSLGLISMIALAIYIPLYERVILPLSRKITERGITLQHRMKAGILMSMLCMLSSGFIEQKRRNASLKHDSFMSPVSFVWLLPQFVFSGLTEALMGISLMEFFNSQLPQSMRTVAGAFVYLNLAIASYLNSVIVNIISRSKLHWVGGRDLNWVKLDYYYYMIAGLALLNYIYFSTLAIRFIASNPEDSEGNLGTVIDSGTKDGESTPVNGTSENVEIKDEPTRINQ